MLSLALPSAIWSWMSASAIGGASFVTAASSSKSSPSLRHVSTSWNPPFRLRFVMPMPTPVRLLPLSAARRRGEDEDADADMDAEDENEAAYTGPARRQRHGKKPTAVAYEAATLKAMNTPIR